MFQKMEKLMEVIIFFYFTYFSVSKICFSEHISWFESWTWSLYHWIRSNNKRICL